MNFLIYDIVLLVIFLVVFSIFLYTRRENLKKEGLLFLYRTKWGMKLIDAIGRKNKKTLRFLSYVSIISGYVLMVGILWMVYRIVKIYVFEPSIVQAIKVPPILPLFPYVDKVVPNLGLPSFYFAYFIIILGVIAISHEMAHGIFMRRYGIRIKSTGFAFFPWFLPIFPAAFVEQDEQSMNKAGNFEQMAVLSAGTFANVIVAILFFIVLWVFFVSAFTAGGISFDAYATSQIALTDITSVNGVSINTSSYQDLIKNMDDGLNEIKAKENYLANKQMIQNQVELGNGELILYYNAPAIKNNLSSIILKINGQEIQSIEDLDEILFEFSPDEEINITTLSEDEEKTQKITLAEHPKKPEKAWLGIGFFESREGIMGRIIQTVSFKENNIYYKPKFDGLSVFTYNLLWWMVIISISVALINMLPMGIFDGGRFFYLTILSLTGNKKTAEKAFSFMTSFFLFLLLLIMIFWVISFF